jgi:hypothetical protein
MFDFHGKQFGGEKLHAACLSGPSPRVMRVGIHKLLFLVKGCKEDYPKEGAATDAIVLCDMHPHRGATSPSPCLFFHELPPPRKNIHTHTHTRASQLVRPSNINLKNPVIWPLVYTD